MSWDLIEANWKQAVERVKRRWDRLTDEDLTAVEGRREQLAARIEERYGIARHQAHSEIEEWMKDPGVLDDWNDCRAPLDM
jgi:uncharacterized protein YjbJ (UPF0337 family)